LLDPTNVRQIAVRDAMRHAWTAYRTYAWGHDEVKPLSKSPSPWFGLGLTIVDSIDTLYIMNMTKGLHIYTNLIYMLNVHFRI
jgi:mannosyl-oligosaccharide alpha-1,2-mannosidase